MPKLTKRVAVSVLISLVLVIGIYASVLGAGLHTAGASSGRAFVTVGLLPDLTHVRYSAPVVNSSSSGLVNQTHHNCDSDAYDPGY